jgi:hypothetical protein
MCRLIQRVCVLEDWKRPTSSPARFYTTYAKSKCIERSEYHTKPKARYFCKRTNNMLSVWKLDLELVLQRCDSVLSITYGSNTFKRERSYRVGSVDLTYRWSWQSIDGCSFLVFVEPTSLVDISAHGKQPGWLVDFVILLPTGQIFTFAAKASIRREHLLAETHDTLCLLQTSVC